jgi:hypothetical protein
MRGTGLFARNLVKNGIELGHDNGDPNATRVGDPKPLAAKYR